MAKSILSYILFMVLIIFSLSVAEENETLFVNDKGEIYYIDGCYTYLLARYDVYVKDPFGNGVAGVELNCEMHYRMLTYEGGNWENLVVQKNGITQDNGHASFILLVTVYYDDPPPVVGGPLSTDDLAQEGIYINIVGDPANPESNIGWPKYEFDCQDVWITNIPSGYSIIYSPNTYTIHSIAGVTYLALNSSDDLDGNGVYDGWELQLAQKFCPNLKLHSGDQGVRPVPVEIMDRNGDGVLGWEDVYVRIYTDGGEYVGTFSPSNIYYPTVYHHQRYPYYDPRSKKVITITGGPPQLRLMYNHFEWGNFENTNPTNWYSTWSAKLSQHCSDLRYTKGTTYAHLFNDGIETVIQYWFFYPFNASANRHEGDWEHINVIINKQNPSNAQISRVVYYYHRKQTTRTNPQLIDQTHPRVYVGGYTEVGGISGNGTHGSYPNPGTWYNINALGTDENVDGQGLEIDFNYYTNIVILPSIEYVDNGQNNQYPYIDPYGNNLNWMIFKAFWGHIISHPSALEYTYNLFDSFISGLPFNNSIKKWVNWPGDAGNIAPVGPVPRVEWEEKE